MVGDKRADLGVGKAVRFHTGEIACCEWRRAAVPAATRHRYIELATPAACRILGEDVGFTKKGGE